jgi:hypothetical protein
LLGAFLAFLDIIIGEAVIEKEGLRIGKLWEMPVSCRANGTGRPSDSHDGNHPTDFLTGDYNTRFHPRHLVQAASICEQCLRDRRELGKVVREVG